MDEPPPSTPPSPAAVHCSDLPADVYLRGEYIGKLVRVTFPYQLTPTADQNVYTFAPGTNTPATYRLHFTAPPSPPQPPVVVVGTVEGVDPDGRIRPNGVPGVLVIRGASVVPSASP